MSKPDLKKWTEERLTSLFTAPSDDDFHAAFDSAFAQDDHSSVVVNGEEMSRDKFKEEVKAQRAAMLKADVKFEDLKEEAAGEQSEGGTDSGPSIIKGTWTVTRSLKFRIRAAPAQIHRVSTFEAKVEPVSPGSSDFRIVHLTETVENKRPPINISPIGRGGAAEAGQAKAPEEESRKDVH
ncbi:hypothetical protein ACEPAF_30 [Sanghuangporus sanghuang]